MRCRRRDPRESVVVATSPLVVPIPRDPLTAADDLGFLQPKSIPEEEDKMKTMWKSMALALLLVIVWGMPSIAAESPKVLTIVAVKVKGDQDAYLAKVK